MLDMKRMTGPKAGSVKYDLLTAINCAGLAGHPSFQTSMQRLATVLTARYNWRLDEFSVGQKELAKLWSVNERTVKREMKRMTDARILIQKRAGVRGRVGAYQLNYAQIWKLSEPYWANVGPDFVERMAEFAPREAVKVVKVDFGTSKPDIEPRMGEWRYVRQSLRAAGEDNYTNWYSKLEFLEKNGSVIDLKAPSAFASRYIETHLHRELFSAIKHSFPDVTGVKIQS